MAQKIEHETIERLRLIQVDEVRGARHGDEARARDASLQRCGNLTGRWRIPVSKKDQGWRMNVGEPGASTTTTLV